MRDLILFLAFVGIMPFIFKRPVVGAMAYAVVSLMNPHRLTYGFAQNFPFAMYLGMVTLVAIVLSKEQKKIPMSPPVVVLITFCIWMTVTTIFGQAPDAWVDWDRVAKTMLMIFLTFLTVRTVRDVKTLALVVACSMGFWGVKSGIFVIFSGGGEGLRGPSDSFISDNNTLALAMVTSTPLIVYMATRVQSKWPKRAMLGMVALTMLAAIGSYSRGALLGTFAMGFFLWAKSTHKLKTGIAIALLVPVVLMMMPEQWMGRMETIQTYDEDASATGRINSWKFAINIANEFALGGGMNVFSPHMFMLYAPEPERYYDAHSIYFQVLGEQGYIGLAIFLTLFFVSWRLGGRLILHARGKPELNWVEMLARMCQVSIIGYMTAGAFLTLAYYDLIYYILAILITMEKVMLRAPQKDDTPPMQVPFLERWWKRRKARSKGGTLPPGPLRQAGD